MGVYVRGIEMPTRCKVCSFCGFGGRTGELNVCMFTGEGQPTLSQERMSRCPLAEIPPHGRLGDLDALIEKVIAKYLEHERKGELVFAAAEIKQDIIDLISDAPTIIPADEEER